MLFLLLACDPNYKITTSDSGTFADGTADSGPSQEELDALWDGARLVIDTPQSGAFLPLGTESEFKATVYDKDGNATDFDQVDWRSDVDTAWTLLGHDVSDSTLSVGRHAITAEAPLPNGDRLAYTVGGVLVQSPYAGIYTGTMSMNVSYDTYQVGCAGAANFTVDPTGTVVAGDATCELSLQGYALNGNYVLDLANAQGAISGDINLDLQFFQYPLPTAGTLSEDGTFSASFEADINLGAAITITGGIEATRISRDVMQ